MPISGTRPMRRPLTSQDRERARALIARVDARSAQADADHLATIRSEAKRGRVAFKHRVLSAVDKKKTRHLTMR